MAPPSVRSGRVVKRINDCELSPAENQVLMALYSGLSPFEVVDFVGIDFDEVEEMGKQ